MCCTPPSHEALLWSRIGGRNARAWAGWTRATPVRLRVMPARARSTCLPQEKASGGGVAGEAARGR